MRVIFGAALALLLSCAIPRPSFADSFENEVLAEINRARAYPSRYARVLLRERANYEDSRRDPGALEDAVEFLMRQSPLPPLSPDGRIAAAAAELAGVQSRRGGVGHGARGNLGRRLQEQGVFAGLAAEVISYGQATPADVVRQLIVDAGVPSRGHRHDIFGANYRIAGVACGPHPKWDDMCVIDLAGAVMNR